jgi:fringe protein
MEAGSSEDKSMVLQYLGPRCVQRFSQYASGGLVLLISAVCVITLVTTNPASDLNRGRMLASRTRKDYLSKQVELEDIFISVKTTSKFHGTRLPVILDTWYNLAPQQITFFTDREDENLESRLGEGRLVPTTCPLDHSRHALVCKMQHELNYFLATDNKWFCHFDDDQYVNIPRLVEKLREFPVDQAWYLGKPSIPDPLQIQDKQSPDSQEKIKFWFGTGGAGFCLSRPLTDKLASLAGGRKFITISEKLRLPDDVTMGYIISHLAGVGLTKVDELHSHLEPLHLVQDLHNQISFSYSEPTGGYQHANSNLVEAGLTNYFNLTHDPTRFKSIHCKLFGESVPWCPKQN